MTDATEQAYRMLEEHRAGMYEELVGYVLLHGGVLVQSRLMFAAFVVEDGVAHVLFACGCLPALMKYAEVNAVLYGYTKVSWERSLVGKHRETKVYDLKKLCQKM